METPGLIAFPKGYFDDLCSGKRNIESWLEEASGLDVDGVEMYPYFYQETDEDAVTRVHEYARSRKLEIPMMCTSPDFTRPSKEDRLAETDKMRFWIEIMGKTGPSGELKTCRVLSGQNRPGLRESDAESWVIGAIESLLPVAEENGVHLVMENHYKDGRWTYPEFAMGLERFERIVNSIDSKWFGINYDPSNAIVSGLDPVEFLMKFRRRILTMHASDRHLKQGYSMESLRTFSGVGYPEALEHGVIGTGLIDYERVFGILRQSGFAGWISIEDGTGGHDDLVASASYLRGMISKYYGGNPPANSSVE